MNLSFAEAAHELERICDRIDNETDPEALIALFSEANATHEESVDRRIKYMRYAQDQAESAKKMRDLWQARATRFEKSAKWIKTNTQWVVSQNPGIPFKGTLGGFKICRNAVPSLIVEEAPREYYETKEWLNEARLKEDLKAGKEIEGAWLEFGMHLRMTL